MPHSQGMQDHTGEWASDVYFSDSARNENFHVYLLWQGCFFALFGFVFANSKLLCFVVFALDFEVGMLLSCVLFCFVLCLLHCENDF